ncbi:MAG: hypothetical protein IT379_40260 [Deltaproteobacteria bacterium]|nr:hypothetical protein [Deltaproteobacteria bacterium]
MSKIAIVLRPDDARAASIHAVHVVTGIPVGEVASRVTRGDPVVEYTLFHNEHEDVARRLRALVQVLATAGIEPDVYELSEGENVADVTNRSHVAITPQILLNILDAHEEAMRADR